MKLRRTIILLVVSTSIFFEALDIAIINLAIPLVQTDFTLPSDVVQWLQTLYVLFYGGFLIVGGKLADITGRRRIFVIGSLLFLFTSLGAGLSGSFEVLLFFRAMQGLAAAMVLPSAFSIITNTFTEEAERNKAIGIFGAFAAVGSASGMSIGGLIASYLGWQWMFFINVPVIAIAVVLSFFFIPSDSVKEKKQTPDILTGVYLTISILLLTYFIHELVNIKVKSIELLLCFAGFIIFALLFRKRNTRNHQSLIDFSVLAHPSTLTGVGVILLLGAFFMSYLFTISIFLQTSLRFSPAEAGLLLFPFGIFSAIISRLLSPYLIRRLGVVTTAIIGMSLMTIGALLLISSLLTQFNFVLLLISLACVNGAGIAVCFSSLMLLTTQKIPEAQQGLAAGVANTFSFFGSGIGLSFIGLFLQFDRFAHVKDLTSAIVLLTFAAGGVVWLAIFQRKSVLAI